MRLLNKWFLCIPHILLGSRVNTAFCLDALRRTCWALQRLATVFDIRTIYLYAKVEQHRQRRAVFFSELEREAKGDARAMASAGTSDPVRLAVDMMAHDTYRLQAILDEGEAMAIAAFHIEILPVVLSRLLRRGQLRERYPECLFAVQVT